MPKRQRSRKSFRKGRGKRAASSTSALRKRAYAAAATNVRTWQAAERQGAPDGHTAVASEGHQLAYYQGPDVGYDLSGTSNLEYFDGTLSLWNPGWLQGIAQQIATSNNLVSAGVGVNEFRFLVTSNILKCSINNISTGPAVVKLYWLEARQDIPAFGTNASSSKDVVAPSSALLDAYVQQGFAVGALTTSPSATAFTASTALSPFQAPAFLSMFKVLRTKKVRIHPGRAYNYTLKSSADKLIHFARVIGFQGANRVTPASSIRSLSYMRGDRMVMYSLEGVAADQTGSANTNIGFTSPVVNLSIDRRTCYKYTFDLTNFTSSAPPTGFTNFSGTLDIVDEETDAIINDLAT
jgi:hypothetical protein